MTLIRSGVQPVPSPAEEPEVLHEHPVRQAEQHGGDDRGAQQLGPARTGGQRPRARAQQARTGHRQQYDRVPG